MAYHVLETKENSRIFDLHNFFLRVVGRLHQVTSINHVFIRPRNHSLLSFLLFGSLLAYCSGLISWRRLNFIVRRRAIVFSVVSRLTSYCRFRLARANALCSRHLVLTCQHRTVLVLNTEINDWTWRDSVSVWFTFGRLMLVSLLQNFSFFRLLCIMKFSLLVLCGWTSSLLSHFWLN